ncbi:MAG: hypothetical protein IPL76_00110 [Gemmatimonadetes bacterium]|nr:hypothetical protein [Gemmatimonadota bacterium]
MLKGATDTLWKVRDPVGSEIVLTYTGNALSSITTSGGRVATVTVSGGLLTAFTPASGNGGGYTSTFAYQSVAAGTLLQRVIGVLGDTTAVTYDPALRYRPTLATLPKVRNEVGDSVSPTLGYTAVETRGLGGWSPWTAPGPLWSCGIHATTGPVPGRIAGARPG